jgi:hypothetical protein
MFIKEVGRCAQGMLIILGMIVNMIGGGLVWPLDEHKDLHFNIELNIHMNFKSYEANGYGHDLDLLIILHQLHLSFFYR